MTSGSKLSTSLLLIVCCMVAMSCEKLFPPGPHPYYSSEPIAEPVIFADGMITTLNGIQFSKDGKSLYVSLEVDRKFRNRRSVTGIYRSDFENGEWTTPQPVPLDPAVDAYHPVLSPDNLMMCFNSRSHPDTYDISIPHNIWYTRQTDSGWSAPRLLNGVNSPFYDSYPSIARNYNLYFNSNRRGGQGEMDIYLARYNDGKYEEPVNLEGLNSSESENDLVIDPDERFIIFNRYVDSTRSLDLYIAYNTDGNWSTPEPLDAINQPDKWELTPTLSPDGNYFFYELDSKIMQVDLKVLLQTP